MRLHKNSPLPQKDFATGAEETKTWLIELLKKLEELTVLERKDDRQLDEAFQKATLAARLWNNSDEKMLNNFAKTPSKRHNQFALGTKYRPKMCSVLAADNTLENTEFCKSWKQFTDLMDGDERKQIFKDAMMTVFAARNLGASRGRAQRHMNAKMVAAVAGGLAATAAVVINRNHKKHSKHLKPRSNTDENISFPLSNRTGGENISFPLSNRTGGSSTHVPTSSSTHVPTSSSTKKTIRSFFKRRNKNNDALDASVSPADSDS